MPQTDVYFQFYDVVFCFAPQMQQQELAQMRQRDANLTALAAIGPRKKRKLDSPGGTAAGTEVGSSHTTCFYSIALRSSGVESDALQLLLQGHSVS